MSEKNVNLEWVQELLNTGAKKMDFSGELPEIDWVQNGKSFKKQLVFKLLPANSKENGVFSFIVGTHWLEIEGRTRRFVCPEQTMHLKKPGARCPICETKRKLLAQGFKEEELCKQGKYGPIPVFDPKLTSNVKVVVLASDLKNDWDKKHVSLLQQNGSFLTRWMVEKYMDNDTPDLLNWEQSNAIKFNRTSDNGRFERELTFQTFTPTEDVIAKLKEENEALTLPDLWKMPTDQEILEMRQAMQDIEKQYLNAREAVKQAATNAFDNSDSDDIPF